LRQAVETDGFAPAVLGAGAAGRVEIILIFKSFLFDRWRNLP
jgi:hypothetical protein